MNKHTLLAALPCTFFALLLCLTVSAPAHAFDEDHTEIINGTTLHFRVRGADKAHPYLLLLHGGPGFSSSMFYPWGPKLEKTVNVVYLDQRGSGQSARLHFVSPYAPTPAEIKDYTLTNLVADIEGVRQALGVNKWYVLGHSWGGMLGLNYVVAHPEHVRGFIDMDGLVSAPAMTDNILNNAQAKFEQDKKAGLPNADILLTQVATLRALPQDNPQRLLGAFGLATGPAGLYFPGDQGTAFAAFNVRIADAIKPYKLGEADLAPAAEPMAALMINDHFLTRDDTPLLAKIAVPTLIINGNQDGVISPKSAEATHKAITNSELLLLDKCGHFPFADQPDQAANAVLTFVAKTNISSDAQIIISPLNSASGVDPSEIKGPCVVSTLISVDGHLVNPFIKKSSGSGAFDDACLSAVRKGHGKPAVQNGVPQASQIEYIFHAD